MNGRDLLIAVGTALTTAVVVVACTAGAAGDKDDDDDDDDTTVTGPPAEAYPEAWEYTTACFSDADSDCRDPSGGDHAETIVNCAAHDWGGSSHGAWWSCALAGLNDLGADGWELQTGVNLLAGNDSVALLRRPK